MMRTAPCDHCGAERAARFLQRDGDLLVCRDRADCNLRAEAARPNPVRPGQVADAEPASNPIKPRRPGSPKEVVMVSIGSIATHAGGEIEVRLDSEPPQATGLIALYARDAEGARAIVWLEPEQARHLCALLARAIGGGQP